MHKKWKHPTGSTLALLETAHAHAALYEPTPEFPGVDMDAIHHKREADEIVRLIHSLEPA